MNNLFHITKSIIIALFLFFTLLAQAQKEGYNWYFGARVGMTWNTTQTIGGLSGLPTPLPPSAMTYQQEGVFCMSDANGNLLFYSDGMTIWNRNHQVMANGSGLSGHNSSAQSGIVIPSPGHPNLYIAVTTSINMYNIVSYSVIDMTLNGGLGDVVAGQKNISLTGAVGVLGESISAVIHPNGVDYWIVAVGKGDLPNSALNVWKVTTAGVQTACYASYTLPVNTNSSAGANGYLRFSADGKYFAWQEWASNNLFFGTFDPLTGSFSNINVTPFGIANDGYGLEFSTSGKILYASNERTRAISAYKFEDLLAAANPNTVTPRIVATGATGTGAVGATYPLQLGPDGRIYGTLASTLTMYVIDNVDDYNNFKITLLNGLLPQGTGYAAQLGLPNFMAHLFAPVRNTYIPVNPHLMNKTR